MRSSKLLCACAMFVLSAPAVAQTAITYQGELRSAGVPVTGVYDFRFSLFDSAEFGALVGPTLCFDDVSVTEGRFTLPLDFGAVYTAPRFLQILVRSGSGGSCAVLVGYEFLSPRQPLSPAPSATHAGTANDAGLLGGQGSTFYRNAANLTGTLSDLRLSNNVSRLDNPGTFSGIPNFNGGLSGATAPFAVDSNTLVANLNADLLDGADSSAFAPMSHTHDASAITAGTLADARLSSNVPRLNAFNRFSTNQAIDNGFLAITNGFLGVGVAAPQKPLSFSSTLGNKIALWGQESANHYGIGISTTSMRLFAAAASDHIAFGNGNTTTFGEWMRVSNGRVAIGDTVLNRTLNVGGGVAIDTFDQSTGAASGGISFGFNSGEAIASRRTAGGNQFGLDLLTNSIRRLSISNLGVVRVHDSTNGNPPLVEFRRADGSGGNDGGVYVYNGAGQRPVSLWSESGTGKGRINATGRVTVGELEIVGGADLSEPFRVTPGDVEVVPGMVMVIDESNAGSLRPCDSAYDAKVAGVVSGAGGVNPGVLMSQKGTQADGTHPVALTGRVYVWVDADVSPVRPGDMLTTSATPGHAQKALDRGRAGGAVLGKAMTSLDKGRGLVLVLVNLQ